MKRLLFTAFLFGMYCCTALMGQTERPMYVSGKLFVKLFTDLDLELPQFRKGQALPAFTDTPDLKAICLEYGVRDLYKPFRTKAAPLQKIYELHFEQVGRTQGLLEALSALAYVEYAEQVAAHYIDYTPNDLVGLQWHLPKIDAPGAWDVTKGKREVIVAIVDDAVKMDHEDLASQIWTNPGEIPGDSIDNDGNGFIDDVHGYDLAEDDNDASPPPGANSNDFSHGTHVAGIAAATTDNNEGIASIGFNLSILPCKIKLDSTIGSAELQATFTGVDYAIATGADVVNMSFGGAGYNATFSILLDVGRDSGMVFIASAGNTGSYSVQYPAGYPNAVSVASTKSNDALSGFSTYHFSVDVSAPGSSIYSCTAGSTSSYGLKSGTSMSAPVVTGLVGLLVSVDSTATADELRHCLETTTDNISAMNPSTLGNFGSGRVNARRAVECLAFPVGNASSLPASLLLEPISPNPSQGVWRAAATLPTAGVLGLRVTDMMGTIVHAINSSELPAGKHVFEVQSAMAAGIYLLVWEFEGQREVQRLEVLH